MFCFCSSPKNYLLIKGLKVKPFNPLPDMPISGSSNSTADRDMMSEI